MADPSPPFEEDPGADPTHGSPPGPPRWVKVSGIVVVVLVLLVVIVQLAGGLAGHGPGRHAPEPGTAEVEAPAREHTPPGGGHG